MTLDQLKLLAFNLGATLDLENRLLAGGRPFDLGPAGILLTRNLTPDQETGLGSWSDEQVKLATKTGIDNEGKLLFPVMPYHVYDTMADTDLEALVVYLQSIRAVSNMIPKSTIPTGGFPVPSYETGIIAPDTSDKAARGAYLVNRISGNSRDSYPDLGVRACYARSHPQIRSHSTAKSGEPVNSVMACTDCHTLVDPATGAPQTDKYLAGHQAYEGPCGIVYGGNITPDNETGIGIILTVSLLAHYSKRNQSSS